MNDYLSWLTDNYLTSKHDRLVFNDFLSQITELENVIRSELERDSFLIIHVVLRLQEILNHDVVDRLGIMWLSFVGFLAEIRVWALPFAIFIDYSSCSTRFLSLQSVHEFELSRNYLSILIIILLCLLVAALDISLLQLLQLMILVTAHCVLLIIYWTSTHHGGITLWGTIICACEWIVMRSTIALTTGVLRLVIWRRVDVILDATINRIDLEIRRFNLLIE